MERRSISILGATGSIGDSTLDLIRHHKDHYDIKVLTAGKNIEKLTQLANEFHPQYIAIADIQHYEQLRENFTPSQILSIEEASCVEVDWTMAAIVGTAGLIPTMNAIKHSKTVAFASKECLVAAGNLMMRAVKENNTEFLPVDSEHNAIFQVIENHNRNAINRLILTASGGPFREWSWEQMKNATPEQAVAHPTWSMGAKISVDSASLMNKALEVIEAHYLFDMPSDKINVVIHPQSLIHSMIEYNDGSILSQMGPSDMRTPIAYCLGYPDRIATSGNYFNFEDITQLTFENMDIERFKSMAMVRDVMKEGQAPCIIFNAANEIANEAFLTSQIGFTVIYDVIAFCLAETRRIVINCLDDVVAQDKLARDKALNYLKEKDTKKYYA